MAKKRESGRGPTRGERFLTGEANRWAAEAAPLGLSARSARHHPATKILDPAEAVYREIAVAIDVGHLQGSPDYHCQELFVSVSLAYAKTLSDYRLRETHQKEKEKREHLRKLIEEVEIFASDMGNEAYDLRHCADKMEDNSADVAIITREAISQIGSEFAAHLKALCNEPLHDDGVPSALNVEEYNFFNALTLWWGHVYNGKPSHGALATRARIALAAWTAIGGEMPRYFKTTSGEYREDWAKRKLREHELRKKS